MRPIGTKMVSDGRSARQIFEEVMANPARNKFGFGTKLTIVNVDFQQAYTRLDADANLTARPQAWFATGAEIVESWKEQQ